MKKSKKKKVYLLWSNSRPYNEITERETPINNERRGCLQNQSILWALFLFK